MNPKVLEAWFTLMNEAMQGTKEARKAFKALSEMTPTPENLTGWMSTFMPAAYASSHMHPEVFEDWLEDWWRVMGVVPRARYLELLEKHDLLQRRLEKAEETIQKLRKALGQEGPEEEAKKVLDLWSTMLEDTLKTQTEWMQAFTSAHKPKEAHAPAQQEDVDTEVSQSDDPTVEGHSENAPVEDQEGKAAVN
jgi:hypothetical protein